MPMVHHINQRMSCRSSFQRSKLMIVKLAADNVKNPRPDDCFEHLANSRCQRYWSKVRFDWLRWMGENSQKNWYWQIVRLRTGKQVQCMLTDRLNDLQITVSNSRISQLSHVSSRALYSLELSDCITRRLGNELTSRPIDWPPVVRIIGPRGVIWGPHDNFDDRRTVDESCSYSAFYRWTLSLSGS